MRADYELRNLQIRPHPNLLTAGPLPEEEETNANCAVAPIFQLRKTGILANRRRRSNQQLDELVERAQKMLKGIGPTDLRQSDQIRGRISAQLAQMQSSLDGLLVERPRRRILRPQSGAAA